MSPNALYLALKKLREKQAKDEGLLSCPCCNQVVRAGFEVDPAMVKLDADIYDAVVATGDGWQEWLNDGLRKLKGIAE